MSKSSTFEWPTFPEESVIGELLKSSREFQEFYQAERKKITHPLAWAKDTSLPEGIDYRSTRLSTGERLVRLRRVPAIAEDACKIAHELEHFVLDAEGFPVIGATTQYEVLASATNSMVADLLVNIRLARFGFNLREDYEREIAEAKRQLERMSAPPIDRIDRMIWMVNYAGYLLDWEFVSASNSKSEFQAWFDTKYPDIAARGKKLLAMVKRIGYDTPEKQAKLFRGIIQRYNLEGVLIF